MIDLLIRTKCSSGWSKSKPKFLMFSWLIHKMSFSQPFYWQTCHFSQVPNIPCARGVFFIQQCSYPRSKCTACPLFLISCSLSRDHLQVQLHEFRSIGRLSCRKGSSPFRSEQVRTLASSVASASVWIPTGRQHWPPGSCVWSSRHFYAMASWAVVMWQWR